MKALRLALLVVLFLISKNGKSQIFGAEYLSISVNPGIVFLNQYFPQPKIEDEFNYIDKKFLGIGASLRTGWFLKIDSTETAILETGIDISQTRAELINLNSENFILSQNLISVPFIFFIQAGVNTSKNETPKIYLGFGPNINVNYTSDFKESNQSLFNPFDFRNTFIKLGIQGDFRICFLKSKYNGHIFGLRSSIDIHNLYNSNENPIIEEPRFINLSVYYNFFNKVF